MVFFVFKIWVETDLVQIQVVVKLTRRFLTEENVLICWLVEFCAIMVTKLYLPHQSVLLLRCYLLSLK